MFVTDSLIVIGLATVSLGTIHEANGPQQHTFRLRNAGQEAVVLTQGYTSCGCTTIHFDRLTTEGAACQSKKVCQVASGDSVAVTLRFNPRGKGGEFEEVGTIEYGPHNKRLNLTLTGTCITSEETLLRQFPVSINDTLRLSTNRFDLGIMHVGETKERSIVVLHRNGNRQERIPLRFTVEAKTPKGLQHIAHPVKVGRETVTINLDVLVR